jgi:3-hydroxyisobutyrate dehydrogenase-like beta-hydroxyacid dehydrogenase
MVAIGFIGFGEVGRLFARGLADAGGPPVFAWDIELEDPARRDRVASRAKAAGATVCSGPAELARNAGLLVSVVVSSAAVSAARNLAPHVGPEHIYLDLNSTSPQVKQEIARVVDASGARFVEGAVMAAVPSLGMKVPILLCGKAAGELVARLAPYGMNLEDFGPEIGRATATKMFRSVVVKGLEALLLECALGAERYGVTERVLDYVEAGYPGLNWNRLAHFLLGRTAIHGERRGHEMLEVADTLRALGIEPFMSEAAARRLLDAASHDLKRRFEDAPPADYHEVIRAIREPVEQ